MKKYYYLMFAAILCCGMGLLTSCSSDDLLDPNVRHIHILKSTVISRVFLNSFPMG